MRILELDDGYFKDMRFEKFWRLAKYHVFTQQGKKTTVTGDPPDDLLYASQELANWIIGYYKKNPEDGEVGVCNLTKREIRIASGLTKKEEKFVLLHELIHFYEYVFKKYPDFRDYLLLFLYDLFQKRIGGKKLWKFLNQDQHFLYRVHSPLFLLKSLELDVELKIPFGTIYGYERQVDFKSIINRK